MQPFKSIPSHSGRKRVGYDCDYGRICDNQLACAHVYTEEILNADGTCDYFQQKVTERTGDLPDDPRPIIEMKDL